MSTLLLGLGNPILGDDGIGPRLAADFAVRLAGRPGLHVEADCAVGGLELLDLLAGHERVIVLDALLTRDARPGAWHAFDAGALRETLHLDNVHDTNFATALALGRRLGLPLPDDAAIHIFGVEVADACTFSERLTPALEAAYPVYAEAIFGEVRRLLASA